MLTTIYLSRTKFWVDIRVYYYVHACLSLKYRNQHVKLVLIKESVRSTQISINAPMKQESALNQNLIVMTWSLMAMCAWYNTILCDQLCQGLPAGRWFSPGTQVSFPQENLPLRYNWNILESGNKHHNPNPLLIIVIYIHVQCIKISHNEVNNIIS